MAETKWTRAPWRHDGDGSIYGSPFPESEHRARILEPKGHAVIKNHEDWFYVGTHEDEANFGLMAAAPELYEALESFVDWNYEHPVSYSDFEDMLTHAKQVLAKARGENV